MVVAYRAQGRAVFLYGFAKRERENIDSSELVTLREIATTWLNANAERIALGIAEDELQEIPNDYQET